jgi:DNA-directed RNA polymerase subunit beta'
MIIGLYYLTAAREGFPGEGRTFMSFDDALNAYDSRADVDLQARILVRLTADTTVETSYGSFEYRKAGERIETTIGRITFNNVLPEDHPFVNYEMNKKEIARLVEDCSNNYTVSQMPEILDGLKAVGFHYATRAGVTVSVYDATVPPQKEAILTEADKKVAAIDADYDLGLMSADERHRQVVDIWNAANEEVGEAMASNFDKFNPIYMMAFSGARGDIKQIRQLAGMRGLMSDPKGEIIDRPIKANFREGLSVLEYFISTHGARKGLADTALRTADSGYLTRRLVDVAQDVIVREVDCGTIDGIDYEILDSKGEVDRNLIGRCLLEPSVHPQTGEVLLDKGEYIASLADARRLADAGVSHVRIRTIMTCHAHRGVCQKCYGWDLAASRPVNIGTAVGIIAAQSIGEPGTQLTMRTFHTGGVAGEDITHGLPRVTELFEARRPKGQAILAEIAGTLQIAGDRSQRTLSITDKEGNFREYQISARAQLMPETIEGAQVEVGQQLTKGSINPHDLLRLTDSNTTLRYIVKQVQDVYISQGVDINDKHIEVIARQMLRKVAVGDAGASNDLPGKQVAAYEFSREAERIALEGGEPPIGSPLLLGITKASLATDSFLSAASFQETTKVLTDAAIEGKADDLLGLKENVIIGKPIPAGTGLKRYREVNLTYKGEPLDSRKGGKTETLPEWAPSELRELESMLPQQVEWPLGSDEYLATPHGLATYFGSLAADRRGQGIPLEVARLYLFDDLGVSQRWANKFSEVGIEMVGELIGKTEEDLLRIEGIGSKAIEELKAGLEERDLLYILEGPKEEEEPDVSKLLEMVFSPEDSELFMDGEVPLTYSVDPSDDGMGGTLQIRASQNDTSELDELLGSIGLGIEDPEAEPEAEQSGE